jgi:branched-chain amino acid transport system ATP-binding protein
MNTAHPTRSDATQVVLTFDGLRMSFAGNTVLNGVSGVLKKGGVVLLRGDNGSGKTTLVNILTGNLSPQSGTITIHEAASGATGSPEAVNGKATECFKFPRPWWGRGTSPRGFAPEHMARLGVGRTWQDVRLFDSLNLIENIALSDQAQPGESPLNALFLRQRSRRYEMQNGDGAKALLSSLGLGDREESSGDKISLGQSKRVAIARAIHAGARVLLLDEPLAGLDGKGTVEFLDLLGRLAREDGLTLVIVEHVLNIPRIIPLVTQVWSLDAGRLMCQRPDELPAGTLSQHDNPALSLVREHLGAEFKESRVPLPGGASLITFAPEHPEKKALLEVRRAVLRRGKRLLFASTESESGLSFRIAPNTLSILAAPNGWGKTTLLDAISGLIDVEGGSLNFNGTQGAQRSRRVWYSAARDQLFPSLTLKANASLAGIELPERFRSLANSPVASLSGGQRQLLAFHLTLRPGLCLFDEPFAGLDQSNLLGVIEQMKSGLQRGDCTLFCTLPSPYQPS